MMRSFLSFFFLALFVKALAFPNKKNEGALREAYEGSGGSGGSGEGSSVWSDSRSGEAFSVWSAGIVPEAVKPPLRLDSSNKN
ncbi:hypothetical protein OS493_003571 [Desmophyllum pertusum]|uniref:Uncharacterized protein n=1 Tax=Desmophyllum pertusum TaxID=174260 RepID=A0A9X0A5T1_9CNID|nr:hypothetical protein OS493_003571 [Desmophyllum pertusum]